MPLVNKLFPAFYNGISEQADELVLDTQCRDMVNCIPSIITGVNRRNGTTFVEDFNEVSIASNVFHTYDRGEGNEQYVFVKSSSPTNPLRIFDKDGIEKTVNYINVTEANNYLGTVGNLKALTLQDRTFIVSSDKTVGQTTVTADDNDYQKVAYYWLKRSSNDSNNPYNYAVYLDGSTTYQASGDDSQTVATTLAGLINGDADYTATSLGSVIEIRKTDNSDFTFSFWDSWGTQASIGFKGIARKLTDLPAEMPFDDVYIKITGDDSNEFNNYYVKWTGDNWTEWKDPTSTRGTLNNMPLRVDRLANGEFEVDTLQWETPNVGDTDTNPDPSFYNSTITDIFFYKNRLGFASGDNVVLSETGGYYNFYIATVLNVLDDDPIDVAIASTTASKIYHVKPFQRGLYIFTADSQFELISEGALSPASVSIVNVSSYSMDVNVEPIVSGTSLYFISKTSDSRSQLREYLKDEDSLVSKGFDTTLNVPNLLPSIDKLLLSSTLGYVIAYSETVKDTLYIFKVESTGTERVQSAWIKFNFSFDIENIYIFDNSLYLYTEEGSTTNILKLDILPLDSTKSDIIDSVGSTVSFESYVKLPRFMPKLLEIKSPVDNVQLKNLKIKGIGSFIVDVKRIGYNVTSTKTYDSGSLRDMGATILARSDDVEITVKNNGNNNFRIESLSLSGSYRQSSREVR